MILSRLAITALCYVNFEPRNLQRMRAVSGESFDRSDFAARRS